MSLKTDIKVWLADLTHTGLDPQSMGVDTFPLGIGCVATYAESRISFKDPVRLFRYPHKLAQALADSGCPDVIGFSNFVWNSKLAFAVARRIKEVRPQTIVVMGGPHYPLERNKQEVFLKNHPQVDFFIPHEGELPFALLLETLIRNDMNLARVKECRLSCVHALNARGEFSTGSADRPLRLSDLDEVPSPYTSGKFDEFFDGRLWPLIQTKRGCPFTCAYCTEGNSYFNSIARRSPVSIQEEIAYIGKKMADVSARGGRNDLYIGDSNFGMYEEDLETARALADSFRDYGWPDHINTSTGKNQKERVLEAARIVNGRIVLSGSVQSLDPIVLNNIKRKNISVDSLMSLAKEARNVDANSYCEVILCLPGETRISHFETLKTVTEAGFNKIVPYQLMILKGCELSTDNAADIYGIQLHYRVLPRAFGSYKVLDQTLSVADTEDVCVTTKAMTFSDYLDCRTMHLVISIFYNDLVFGSVLGALRQYGLSVFHWLELILKNMTRTIMEKLLQDFRKHTDEELWRDEEKLDSMIRRPGTIEHYARGEVGFNLLYTFKALAFTQYGKVMADLAEKALVEVFRQKSRSVPRAFLSDIVRWDALQMKDIMRDMEDDVRGSFSYDIEQFLKQTQLDPEECRFANRRMFRFVLTSVQKDYAKRHLKVFGADVLGMGRIFSNTPLKKMLRKPVAVKSRLPVKEVV